MPVEEQQKEVEKLEEAQMENGLLKENEEETGAKAVVLVAKDWIPFGYYRFIYGMDQPFQRERRRRRTQRELFG